MSHEKLVLKEIENSHNLERIKLATKNSCMAKDVKKFFKNF